jgi:hypothetical protein
LRGQYGAVTLRGCGELRFRKSGRRVIEIVSKDAQCCHENFLVSTSSPPVADKQQALACMEN